MGKKKRKREWKEKQKTENNEKDKIMEKRMEKTK